ncbi:MAG: 50S ribosomal protein L3 N(5)-glutamine methyltransferase [Thiobacillaceae bacterium]
MIRSTDPGINRAPLTTVRDWLRFAVSRFNRAELFFGHGSDNAFDEAAYLILHTLHLPLDRLEPFMDANLTQDEGSELEAVIRRRVEERVPAAYLTHEAWLGEFRFYVDERVIVPRSFIADLLQEHLSPFVEDPQSIHAAADICTGSGCLAILMAHAFPNASIDAVDISRDALDVAEKNIATYRLQDQVHPIQSDLMSKLKGKRYDLIVANPPYVNAPSMAALPQEYRHEPALALASGEDGLSHIRQLLTDAPKYLNEHGLLIAEIGHNRDALEAAFPRLPFTWLATSGGDQFVFLLRSEDFLLT